MKLTIDQWGARPATARGFRRECLEAAANDAVFATFRRRPYMETVVENKATERRDVLAARIDPALLKRHGKTIRQLDRIGGPAQCGLSGSMASYAMELTAARRIFGNLAGLRIAEIGGGYGGLCALTVALCSPASYTLYDFPAALALQWRYAETAGVSGVVMCRDRIDPASYDLVFAMHSLRELTAPAAKAFGEAVLSRSARGLIGWGPRATADKTLPQQGEAVCRWLQQWAPGRRVSRLEAEPLYFWG